MCNLITCNASRVEVARTFDAFNPANFNAGEAEVYPGTRGMVVREADGQRILEAMAWGFPLRTKDMKPGSKPKPVNNIANLESIMWRSIAPDPAHRCLIPLTGFAVAEGPPKAKTRTWFGIKDQPIFAWAGMWKDSDEWGAVYSGLMTKANDLIAPVHERMPVLLHRHEYDLWLHGGIEDVLSFRDRVFPPELLTVDRTPEPWNKPRTRPEHPQPNLL